MKIIVALLMIFCLPVGMATTIEVGQSIACQCWGAKEEKCIEWSMKATFINPGKFLKYNE